MDELDELKAKAKVKKSKEEQFGQHVPSSYFEELEHKILASVNPKGEKSIVNLQPSKRITMWRYGAVAAVALVLVFGVSQLKNTDLENAEYSEVNFIENAEYYIETNELYTEDLLEIEGIEDVLTEIEEELKNN